ncbi:hypothetical protein TB1_003999 [Malus domestica]
MEEIGGGSVAKKIMFLRRALTEELADERSNHERLVIAVHAMLLESGFVPIDPISGKQTDDQDRPHLLDKWSTLDPIQVRRCGCTTLSLRFCKTGPILKSLKVGPLLEIIT